MSLSEEAYPLCHCGSTCELGLAELAVYGNCRRSTRPSRSWTRWARSPTRTAPSSCSCCATTSRCGRQTCRRACRTHRRCSDRAYSLGPIPSRAIRLEYGVVPVLQWYFDGRPIVCCSSPGIVPHMLRADQYNGFPLHTHIGSKFFPAWSASAILVVGECVDFSNDECCLRPINGCTGAWPESCCCWPSP